MRWPSSSLRAQPSITLRGNNGERVLRRAVDALLERGSHDLGALAVLCDQEHRPQRVVLPLELGAHVPDRDVVPHDLGEYDHD